jgi:DNA-binding PadR family transcriptional regulator
MMLGNNETIVLSLINDYNIVAEKSLQILFLYLTGKKGRIDVILHSLQIKGLIDKKNTTNKEMLKNLNLPKIKIDSEILKNLKNIQVVRLGSPAGEILFLLSITGKASLQFLSFFFKKPSQNIGAILQRLEEKGCTISYNSRIMRYNTDGKKYYPKYHTITNLGKVWVKTNKNSIKNSKKIKEMLEKPEEEIKKYVL